MPLSFASIFRLLMMLVLAAHVFYMYCTARGMGGAFGFDLQATVIGSLFALAMLVPLVWAVFLPDLPEVLANHVRPHRRWRNGQCPNCGYDRLSLPAERDRCPECGEPLREPAPLWRFGAPTVRRFVIINLAAWQLGCSAGEMWMQLDERDFQREAVPYAGTPTPPMIEYSRPRRWPTRDRMLVWRSDEGYSADMR